jgi:hypothetical protein
MKSIGLPVRNNLPVYRFASLPIKEMQLTNLPVYRFTNYRNTIAQLTSWPVIERQFTGSPIHQFAG